MPHTKSMSEPDGSTSLSDSIDSSAAPPLEPGSSASGVHDTSEEYIQEGLVAPPERPPKKAIFGVLKQDTNNHYEQPQNFVFSDDYEKRLPEDPYCKETAPNARIWRTYVEEAAAFDAVYVGQARDGLDVMLVFAGLFSAVVTSFLVQVSQSLQADYTAMSAILLHDLVSVQLSISGSRASFQNITVPSVNPLQIFQPDSITVWVNGLWAVSLTASLVVALSAVRSSSGCIITHLYHQVHRAHAVIFASTALMVSRNGG
ncbi:hypothetical protein CPB85DRAFT_1561484 [Mucidula mucida]|nr:hypothetical protein CPB85DRAFT_1561484 [Mucidula mucida]